MAQGTYLHPSPASNGFAITPDDVNPLPSDARGIYVGTAGDLTVRLAQESGSVKFVAVPQGSLLPIAVHQVFATGTTASNLVGVY
jgi:hypothetical protein